MYLLHFSKNQWQEDKKKGMGGFLFLVAQGLKSAQGDLIIVGIQADIWGQSSEAKTPALISVEDTGLTLWWELGMWLRKKTTTRQEKMLRNLIVKMLGWHEIHEYNVY